MFKIYCFIDRGAQAHLNEVTRTRTILKIDLYTISAWHRGQSRTGKTVPLPKRSVTSQNTIQSLFSWILFPSSASVFVQIFKYELCLKPSQKMNSYGVVVVLCVVLLDIRLVAGDDLPTCLPVSSYKIALATLLSFSSTDFGRNDEYY